MEVGRPVGISTTSFTVRGYPLLSPYWGSPDDYAVGPPNGGGCCTEKEDGMKVARRVAIALGSLMAIALAGGAHWKV
jgi:hypothetical protein